MQSEYSFRWLSSYMGGVEYEVRSGGECFRLEVRRSTDDYERRIINGGDAEWQNQIAQIGMLRGCCRIVPQDLVDGFNAWQIARHDAFMAKMDGDPDRYGVIPADDPLRRAPRPVYGGHYVANVGWLVNGTNLHDHFPCDGCRAFVPADELYGQCDLTPGTPPDRIKRRVCSACDPQHLAA